MGRGEACSRNFSPEVSEGPGPAQDLTQTQMPLDLLRRCWGFPDKGSVLGERQFWPSEQQGDMGRQVSRVGSAAEGSSVQRRLQEKGEWRREKKPWLPEEGSRSPVKPGSEALRAGRSHEGHRGRCVGGGFTLQGSYSRLLQHLSADPQTLKGHTTFLGHTVSEWPRLSPQWPRPMLSGEELGLD